jgi:two-component system, NarL family, vancomycin resistance associated response regulator VraR
MNSQLKANNTSTIYFVSIFMLPYCNALIRVLVVDDHELTRLNLRLILQNQPDIEIVGLANNGLQAISMVEHYAPDVVILDLQMPILDGSAASQRIKRLKPRTRIIAYSLMEDPLLESMLQESQVDALCLKDSSTNTLIELVRLLGTQQNNHCQAYRIEQILTP